MTTKEKKHFDETMASIRKTNQEFKALQENCDHEDTEWVEIQAPGGYMQPNSTMAKVCDECDYIFDEEEPDDRPTDWGDR